MSARLTAIAFVALLTACATAQENPNYQYSSKYGQQTSSPVQVASYETIPAQTYPAETQTVVIQQDTAPAYTPAPVLAGAPSETETAFDANTMDGTPGYQAMMAEAEIAAPVESAPPAGATRVEIAPRLPSGARPVAYDYSQNVIIAGAQTEAEAVETRRLSSATTITTSPTLTGGYIVQPGDTVYSLSRKRCVGVSEVARVNNLGTDYGISIGQTLRLPASRC